MVDHPQTLGLLFLLGIFTGGVAGVLGIGGGVLMVPALTLWGVSLVQATATSLVAVFISAVSGSVQNWRQHKLNWRAAGGLALFGIPTAQLGAWLGDRAPETWLAFSFAALMLLTLYLMELKQRLSATQPQADPLPLNQPLVRVGGIGLLAGLLSGLFGVGGGAVMVPLQMLVLGESIKSAVRTSLGAIVAISASGLVQHTWNGNVLWRPGIALALGGMLGAQLGTRLLTHLPSNLVDWLFRSLLALLAVYMITKGIQAG